MCLRADLSEYSWKKVLSLCFSFPFSDLGLLYHWKAGGLEYFCSDGKSYKIYMICFIEETGEKSGIRILRIRDSHSSANLHQCLCTAKGSQRVCLCCVSQLLSQ